MHRALQDAFRKVRGDHVPDNPVDMTRAVEQSVEQAGRFLNPVREMDYREMTRETWRRARSTCDAAYEDLRQTMHDAWAEMETAQ